MSDVNIPAEGASAPDLCLPDQDRKETCLKDLRGSWIVLYFYPRDNTPGCTIEAKEFTEVMNEIANMDAEVIGVSPDSVESHCSFIEKHELKIRLLSDLDKVALQAYGAWREKKLYGREFMGVVRSTFLIDPEGKIAKVWPNVKAKGHAEKVLESLKELW